MKVTTCNVTPYALSKCSSTPVKQYLDRHKKAFKSEWLNTPNAYKKEEFDETGTPNPKKITKVSAHFVYNNEKCNTYGIGSLFN